MPRGFKRNREATSHVRFLDKRSFVSQEKQIGPHGGIHLILYGKDKIAVRAEIFRRNREANGAFNRCWKCGKIVFEESWQDSDLARLQPAGEWDHIRNKPGERCDCVENGRVSCRTCHSERHPKPQFGRSKIV